MTEDESAFLKHIGALFREMREESGLSQKQAAKLANSAQARVSYLENGKADVYILTLEKWANVYGYEVHISFNPIGENQEEVEEP